MNVMLFQQDSSDQRERVVDNRAIARIGCGPPAPRMNTALHRLITVGFICAAALLLRPHAPLQADDTTAFGKQVSADGIKHSFLVTGSITAIIDEECNIVWQTPARSRDGSTQPRDGQGIRSDSREASRLGVHQPEADRHSRDSRLDDQRRADRLAAAEVTGSAIG